MEINTSLPNYNKTTICRICMQEDINLFPIFNDVYMGDGSVSIADIITECTKYPVANNDQLPAQICNVCMEAARSAHQFKKQTEESYCRLKALYDITWIPKQEKGSNSGMRVGALTTDKYTQTEKTSVFPCESCPKKFFSQSKLIEHRETGHINDGRKCRVCGEKFIHLGQLKVHLSTKHPSEGIRCEFKCNVCSREFTRKDHLKRHLIKVHKMEDMTLKITKVSLDEPEIETPTVVSTSLNNYSSHWPDYQEDDDNEPIAIESQDNENITATNPFSSEDEGHEQHHFNDMDEEDVKQFVETIAHPEISIKVENSDYPPYNIPAEKKQLNKSNEDMFYEETKTEISSLKPEKTEDYEGDKENNEDDKDDRDNKDDHNNTFDTFEDDHHSLNQTSDDDSDDDFDPKSEDENYESPKKSSPNKTISATSIKQENPSGSTSTTTAADAAANKLIKPRRRPHGAAKNEDNRCQECNRSFTRYNHLLRHMLTHSDAKPHVCSFCGKGFSRTDHLQKHVQSIHCEKNFKCDQCSNAYGRKDHLQRHIEARHNKDPSAQKPQFDCDMCEKKFTTKAYLAKHRLLHTDRLYACKHCPETFTEKELMKEHQKKEHTTPRNFLCNICGDSFQRNEYLKIHMRRHTGEKPYKCRFCEKGFPRSTDLKMHERYHIGHKPNLCTLCGKGFHRPYNLTIHMRTHTGEKPYKCNQCPQAFAQSNDLKAHIRRHTGERFRCDVCSAAFLQRYGLNAHLRTAHGIIVTSFTGRLRKTDQPLDPAELLEQQQLQQPPPGEAAQQPMQLLSGPPPDQSQSSLPSPHIDNNSTPPPLYLGHHFINQMPVITAPTQLTSPVDISPAPTHSLSHPPSQSM